VAALGGAGGAEVSGVAAGTTAPPVGPTVVGGGRAGTVVGGTVVGAVVVGGTVVGGTVVGAVVVGGTVVGGTVVGGGKAGTVVGAVVVGGTVVGAAVVGGTVVGAVVTGGTVVGGTVVGAVVVGGTVVGGTVVGAEVVGGTGAVGVTADDAAEGAEVPAVFVATTVNVYAVPSVRPVMVAVVPGAGTKRVWPPDEVTVYDVTGVPPSMAGAVHETLAWVSPGMAPTPVGLLGAVKWAATEATWRTRLLNVSAMNRFPLVSTAVPAGPLSAAATP
jgi:hypothetical protein